MIGDCLEMVAEDIPPFSDKVRSEEDDYNCDAARAAARCPCDR
jgi:hypothetical protein